MKNLENMKALDEIEMAKVAGGDDDYTVVDAFVDWLLSPVEEMVNDIADSVGGDRPMPGLPGLYPSPYDPTSPEYYA